MAKKKKTSKGDKYHDEKKKWAHPLYQSPPAELKKIEAMAYEEGNKIRNDVGRAKFLDACEEIGRILQLRAISSSIYQIERYNALLKGYARALGNG